MKKIFLPLLAALLLLPACSGGGDFVFIHMTDTQIGFHDNPAGFGHSDTLMQQAVTAANGLRPDLVVITGDLVDDASNQEQDAIFTRNLARFEAPVWYIPGNHDIPGFTKEKHDAYVALRGYDRFSFRHKGCAFIGFDTNCIKDGDTDAEEEQWDWLTEELQKSRRARHIFVFLHCPVIRESPDEPEDYFNFSLDKRRRYLDLFRASGVEAVFAGHTHCPYTTRIDGISHYTGTAVGNCLSHGQPGFNVISVSRNGIKVEQILTAVHPPCGSRR